MDGEEVGRTTNSDPNGQEAIVVKFFQKISDLTARIQLEISAHMLSCKSYKESYDHLPTSENDVLELLDSGINKFVRLMPLASMNQTNLFMSLLSAHSSITGNQRIKLIIEELNDGIFAQDDWTESL